MNTLTNRDAYVKGNFVDNVILLEELEFAMPKQQLQDITDLHNSGMDFQDIAKEVKRNPYEVLIAIIHQFKNGRKMLPLGYKPKQQESTLMVPGYEQLGESACESVSSSANTAKAV